MAKIQFFCATHAKNIFVDNLRDLDGWQQKRTSSFIWCLRREGQSKKLMKKKITDKIQKTNNICKC